MGLFGLLLQQLLLKADSWALYRPIKANRSYSLGTGNAGWISRKQKHGKFLVVCDRSPAETFLGHLPVELMEQTWSNTDKKWCFLCLVFRVTQRTEQLNWSSSHSLLADSKTAMKKHTHGVRGHISSHTVVTLNNGDKISCCLGYRQNFVILLLGSAAIQPAQRMSSL